MANPFYNPYSSSPDIAGGLSSMGNNIGLMLMLKKLMGQQGGGLGDVAEPSMPSGTMPGMGAAPVGGPMTPPGQANMNPGAPNLPQMQGQPFGQAGGIGAPGSSGAGIDPGVLQKVQQLMGLLKLKGMPGQGGGLF
jgi:hypothetical protein